MAEYRITLTESQKDVVLAIIEGAMAERRILHNNAQAVGDLAASAAEYGIYIKLLGARNRVNGGIKEEA